MKKVTLKTPVKRGETEITEVTFREPSVGELRGGVSMSQLIAMDVDTLLQFMPRICELTPDELAKMPLDDFAKCSMAVHGFLGDLQQITAMRG